MMTTINILLLLKVFLSHKHNLLKKYFVSLLSTDFRFLAKKERRGLDRVEVVVGIGMD